MTVMRNLDRVRSIGLSVAVLILALMLGNRLSAGNVARSAVQSESAAATDGIKVGIGELAKLEAHGSIRLPAVAGLSAVACFSLPLQSYTSNDACLEYLQRNPAYGNKRHAADDVCAAKDTKVYAAAAGKVMYARAHETCPNWGNLIAIEHLLADGSSVVTLYGHTIASVTEGALVSKGQQIGKVGHYSCWNDHLHFGVARRDWGSPVGTYAPWVFGYFPTDSTPQSPYSEPYGFITSRSDCPPTVGSHTYTVTNVVTRTVTIRFSDPENRAPNLKKISYQYRDPTFQLRTGSADFTLASGTVGNGTYRWSANIYGTQFKFYTEWRDAGGNAVRYPTSGWIE